MTAWPGHPNSGGAAVIACQTPFSTMMEGVAGREEDWMLLKTVHLTCFPSGEKVKNASAPLRATKALLQVSQLLKYECN